MARHYCKLYDLERTSRYQQDIEFGRTKHKRPVSFETGRLAWVNSLTMTYFHTGIRTIIGADSFHFPVRDGKEWDQVAMVIRLDWLVY